MAVYFSRRIELLDSGPAGAPIVEPDESSDRTVILRVTGTVHFAFSDNDSVASNGAVLQEATFILPRGIALWAFSASGAETIDVLVAGA